jgi:ArsR family transcriptional regulator
VLHPTLWRTARVLANTTRLRVLCYLLRRPQGATVTQVAERLDLKLPVASLYLRALNARGLLRTERRSRWVWYRVSPDPTLPEIDPILKALRRELRPTDASIRQVIRDATAFTHPRRCVIMQRLGHGAMRFGELSRSSGISPDALARHVRKLMDRRFLFQQNGRYRSAVPTTALGRTLLKIARQFP